MISWKMTSIFKGHPIIKRSFYETVPATIVLCRTDAARDRSRGVMFPDPLTKGFVDRGLPSAAAHLEVIDHVVEIFL